VVIAGPGTNGWVVVVVVDELVLEAAFFDLDFDFAVVVVVDEELDVVVDVVAFCRTGLPGYRRLVCVSTTPSGLRKPDRTACLPSYEAGVGDRWAGCRQRRRRCWHRPPGVHRVVRA